MKHNAHEDGLWEVVETITIGRGGHQAVGNVIQGSGTSGTTFLIEDLRTFGGNGECSIGHTHGGFETDHMESSATDSRQDMVDAQGRSSVGRGRNTVGDDLHRDTIGNCLTMDGVADNI